jgi:hypothetical protein
MVSTFPSFCAAGSSTSGCVAAVSESGFAVPVMTLTGMVPRLEATNPQPPSGRGRTVCSQRDVKEWHVAQALFLKLQALHK